MPLTDVSLRIMLGRIWTIFGLVIRLITIPAWPISWGTLELPCPEVFFGRETVYPL
jgi:hypothetical protein